MATLSAMTVEQIENARFVNQLFGHKPSPIRNYYGIEGLRYIYLNDWADPLLEYNGVMFSVYYVEDTMWYRWTHDDDDNHLSEREADEAGFEQYMMANKAEIIELCDAIVGANN